MKLKLIITIFLSILFIQHHGYSQHDTHKQMSDSMNTMPGMKMPMDSMNKMTHSFSRNLPMNRNGSGTSWLPDSTPVYAYMTHAAKWNFMFHGAVWLRYNYQDIGNKGSRGGNQFDAPNWFMAMGQRKVGKRGLFVFNSMFSLDRLTVGGSGYPSLFQSGESWKGAPLVDRQHPHDLFSELAVGYTHMVNKDIDITAYIGYPGEPALGPTAFMHRISSFNLSSAPLGHHWQDATHITFGVATIGFRYKKIKLEGSSFTGREPNENRYNFDKPRFDSYSYRISYNPNANYSFQASQGFIKSPEELKPNEDVWRTTASVIESHPLGKNRYISSALIWGMNYSHQNYEHSVLFESNLQLSKLAVFGRYEFIQKDASELALTTFDEDRIFNINSISLGTSYIIFNQFNTNMTVGIIGSMQVTEKVLNPIYGAVPISGEVYLRINPAKMKMF